MSYLSSEQRDLLLPLYEGVREHPPWDAFLRNLVLRTNARQVVMVVEPAHAMPAQAAFVRQVAASRAAAEPPVDLQRLQALGLYPFRSLRNGRVYGLDEILDYDNPEALVRQRRGLDELGMRYGRILRSTATGRADAAILLVREREDISAAATALLSSLGPHIAVAVDTLIALTGQRALAAMSQHALAQLGCGQIAFDSAGRVMMADAVAEQVLGFAPDPASPSRRRLQLAPAIARALAEACEALTDAPRETREIIRLGDSNVPDLMLRPSDLPADGPVVLPAVIGTLRLGSRRATARSTQIMAKLYGLSPREAALAHGLSLGLSIVEAGGKLRLTPETSRNYSKRIYAKTGTSGQTDLVRMILTGLMPLA